MRRRLPIRLLVLLLIGCLAPSAPSLRAQEEGTGYESGLRALDAGRPQEALAIWMALAEQGDSAAIYGLGRLYEVGGPGFEPDKAKAAEWYRKAASIGVVAAQNNLALLLAKGEGVTRDLAMAAALWEQAAVRGHPTAQYNLGLLKLRGDGVTRDEAEGAAWVRKAADAGVPAAQFVMGDLRRYGVGLGQDQGRALTWYLRAAANGYEPAREEAEQLTAAGVLARGEASADAGGPPPPEPTERDHDMAAALSGMAPGDGKLSQAAVPPTRSSPPRPSPPRPSPPSPQLAPAGDTASAEGLGFLGSRAAEAEMRAVAATRGPVPVEASPRTVPEPSPAKPADLQGAALPDVAAEASAPEIAGRFALWLGTVEGRDAADRLGRRVVHRHRAALDSPQGAAVALRRVELAGLGAVYRVLAGDWPDRAAAEAACERLRASDSTVFCSVVAH